MSDTAKAIIIQQISLKLIRPNPDNRLITQDMIDEMAASLAAVGLKNPIKVRPLGEDGTYPLFSGHIRRLGALKLGWETIATQVLDITEEEAVLIGILDNRNKKQNWLDDYRDIEALLKVNPDLTGLELADRLEMSERSIKRGKRLLKCLNPASRDMIKQSLTASRAKKGQSLPPDEMTDLEKGQTLPKNADTWELTENPVYSLTALEDPELVVKALKVLIERQMTEPQAKALVESMQTGTPAEAYVPVKAASKAKAAPMDSTSSGRSPLASEVIPGPPERSKLSAPTPAAPAANPTAKSVAPKASSMSETETMAWDAAAGISVISRIKTKIKKGERPSFWEALLLLVYTLWKVGDWVFKHGYRIAKATVKVVWKLLKGSLKSTIKALGPTVYRVTCTLLGIAFLAVCAYVAWDSYAHGFHPWHALSTLFTLVVGIIRG